MTLSQLAALGELLGGVAVVASLVSLAVQIRQNTRSVRGSTLPESHPGVFLWQWQELAREEAPGATGSSGEPGTPSRAT